MQSAKFFAQLFIGKVNLVVLNALSKHIYTIAAYLKSFSCQ